MEASSCNVGTTPPLSAARKELNLKHDRRGHRQTSMMLTACLQAQEEDLMYGCWGVESLGWFERRAAGMLNILIGPERGV